jgi:glutamine amidotransferase
MIAVIDYDAGNVGSVVNAFRRFDVDVIVTKEPKDIKKATAIVLPGVGSFNDGMEKLKKRKLIDMLNKEIIEKEKPFLGICLGLQLLAEIGTEHGVHRGLGWINGKVVKLNPSSPTYRIPHIGWNDVRLLKNSELFKDIERFVFYFVHSYHFIPEDESVITSITWHGEKIVASIEKNNIYAVQFHPEKSQISGLRIIKNFIEISGEKERCEFNLDKEGWAW